MAVYSIMNQKGGVGKSTTATELSVYLHDLGRKVAALDVDKQLHLLKALALAEPAITVGAQFEVAQLEETILRLKTQHDDVVIDAPADLEERARALMVMSDVAIFPMEPSVKSYDSTKDSVNVLHQARELTGGKPETAWVFLNKARKRSRMAKRVRADAPSLGLRFAEHSLRTLDAYLIADQENSTVLRLPAKDKGVRDAQQDLLALFSEIIPSPTTTRIANE